MSVKKKLLIALLSATCLTAGACGLAACKDKEKPKPAESGYVVTAKDDKGNAVEGAWFEIGYMDSYNFVPVKDGDKVLTARSGSDGKAVFDFTPEEGKTYRVRAADPSNINNQKSIPYGYTTDSMYAEFKTGETTVEYSFNYVPNDFDYNERKELNYKRVYDAATDSAKEEKGENKFSLEKNRHLYFYLLTYKEPGGDTAEEIVLNQANFTRAASGIYEVSFKAVDAAVTLYRFNGSGYVAKDTEGIPSLKSETVTSSSESITVNLTVDGNKSRMSSFFGIYADKDCEIEIEVKRVGDAEESKPIETNEYSFTAPTEKFADNTGTLTPVPIPNTYNIVKGNDGFYHINNESGPLLLVTLTSKLERIGDLSLKDLPSDSDSTHDNSQIFILPEVDGNHNVTAYTDYTKMIAEYSKWVNGDGVYPVNDDIYSFLQRFTMYAQVTDVKQIWLTPCQFYVDAEGFESTGSGTQSDPYKLVEATNKLSNTGSTAYLSFTADDDGAYSFEPRNGELQADNATVIDGKTYIALKSGQTVRLTLSGAIANTNVTVERSSNKVIHAVYGSGAPIYDDKTGNIIGTDLGEGTSADTAITVSVGVTAYIVDHDNCTEGVWIKFKPLEGGRYTFEALGSSNAQLVYNDQVYNAQSAQPLTINCQGNTTYAMLLTAKQGEELKDGAYLVKVSSNTELQLGDNEVWISGDIASSWSNVEYTFTSEQGGTYTISCDTQGAMIFLNSNDFEATIEPAEGKTSYVFTLEAGETISFYCSASEELAYTVSIKEGGEVTGPTEIHLDETAYITATGDGWQGTITVNESGSYTISVYPPMSERNATFLVVVGEGPRAQRVTLLPGNGYTGTLTLDGTQTITVVYTSGSSVEAQLTISAAEATE